MKTLQLTLIIFVLLMSSLACSIPGFSEDSRTPEITPIDATDILQPTTISSTSEPPFVSTEAPAESTQVLLPEALNCVSVVEFQVCAPKDLASALVISTIPYVNDPEGAPWENMPLHYEIQFQGYPLSDTFLQPKITIIPLESYIEMSEGAKASNDNLSTLLLAKPEVPQNLPILPLVNAGSVIVTRSSYPQNASIQGVAALTQLAQYFAPVNNHSLFYTFQGTTVDNKYWIGVILPITQSSLQPDGQTVPGGNFDQFIEQYDTYIAQISQTLTEAGSDSFVPDFDTISSVPLLITYTP